MRARWRQHFGALEAGLATSFSDLAHRALEAEDNCSAAWPCPLHIQDLPSIISLQRVLANTKIKKAPGFDGLPPELCKFFSTEVADILMPLVFKQVWRGNEALGWKGGCSVFFHKNKGSFQECSSFRSVLLLSSFAKAVHQSLRPPLKTFFEEKSPDFQIGGKEGCSVSLGAHLIRGVARIAHLQGRASFTLFADIASAFYSTITELVASRGADSGTPEMSSLQLRLNLHPDDASAILQKLERPSAMQHAGADAWLEAITAAMCTGNWFMLQADNTPVCTAKGTWSSPSLCQEYCKKETLSVTTLLQSPQCFLGMVTGACLLAMQKLAQSV